MTTLVAIKGGKEGLRLHLDESAVWSDVLGALRSQLDQGAQFFNGARVVVDIGNRALTEELTIRLVRNPDILASIAQSPRSGQDRICSGNPRSADVCT